MRGETTWHAYSGEHHPQHPGCNEPFCLSVHSQVLPGDRGIVTSMLSQMGASTTAWAPNLKFGIPLRHLVMQG